jgi:hypothetical protein
MVRRGGYFIELKFWVLENSKIIFLTFFSYFYNEIVYCAVVFLMILK